MFLFRKLCNKLLQKLIFDTDNLCFQLVSQLPLIIRKKSRLIFKAHLSEQIIILVKVITFLFKLKFTVSHRETRKLRRRSLETYYLTVIELHVVPTQVYTVRRVYVDVYCRLQVTVNLVASAKEQDRRYWRMVRYLLGVEGTALDKRLVGLS